MSEKEPTAADERGGLLEHWKRIEAQWGPLDGILARAETQLAANLSGLARETLQEKVARFQSLWHGLRAQLKYQNVDEVVRDTGRLCVAREECVARLKDLAGEAEARGIDSTALWSLFARFDEPILDEWQAAWTVFQRLLAVGEAKRVEPIAGTHNQLVTLLQMASIVNRNKRTLEDYKDEMPLPEVEGGGGRPAEWAWGTIRPWLEEKFHRSLPTIFPGDRFQRL